MLDVVGNTTLNAAALVAEVRYFPAQPYVYI